MSLDSLFALVRRHLPADAGSSARVCFADAVALRDAGEYDAARTRAVRALAHAVGVFHPDYRRAA